MSLDLPSPQTKYVHRLELSSRCTGESVASQSVMDLTNVLSDRTTLQQLIEDLFRPFEALQVEQIMALHVEETIIHDSNKKEKVPDMETSSTGHRFTTVIAGAIAGAKELAYGEVAVRRIKSETVKNRGRHGTSPSKIRATKCRRVVTVECGDGEFIVQLKQKAIGKTPRVLLVVDWVSEAESILAVKNALTRLGCDVLGVSFVLATHSNVLGSLKAAQMAFSCSWNPSHGARLSTALSITGAASCSCHQSGSSNGQSSKKRQRTEDIDSDPSVQVLLSHQSAEYQANNPSEDRSVNIVKTTDGGVQINAVFDGHGGSRAVEHLRASLCQRILANVTSKNSSDEVVAIVKNSFAQCDEELKQSLMVLPPDVRMSKGYCNAGSCAVVALFINSVLYVANVGDCAAVLGKISKETQSLEAVEVSVDHSCNNPIEAKLVVERSHDRNAIRMSKDDQATGAGFLGVKRVAGSLAMTRAFGDFYLKSPELSSSPFKSKVPYITSEPSITTVYMDGSEKFVILASDGLWDVMTPQEAVDIVEKFDPEQSLFFSTVSVALIHAALEKIAHRDGMMIHELMAMAQGPVRRRFHDDITCTVVYINHQVESPSEV